MNLDEAKRYYDALFGPDAPDYQALGPLLEPGEDGRLTFSDAGDRKMLRAYRMVKTAMSQYDDTPDEPVKPRRPLL